MNHSQNVTFIENLPELEEVENGNFKGAEMLPPGEANKFKKFIRNNHDMLPESGMIDTPSTKVRNTQPEVEMDNNISIGHFNHIKTFNMPSDSPSCLVVATHIANCPICSKFYNDKTIYLVLIAILSIICIILLKKILD
jgi:hypothetical protein